MIEDMEYSSELDYDRIPGYPDGSDITLLNTIYIKPHRLESGKYGGDSLTVIFRDNVTGEKKHHIFYDPKYTFYVARTEFEKEYNELFKGKDEVIPITVLARELEKEIAVITDKTDEFYDNCRNGNKFMNKLLHYNPKIMNSDMNIEDYYRFRFSQRYKNDIFKIKKGFCDIEVDGTYTTNEFPELGEVPINAVSYYDEGTDKIYAFLLRNSNNPLIEKFEKGLTKEYFDYIHDFITDVVGGYKQSVRMGLDKTKVEIFFFDDEMSLIYNLFATIKKLSPDFLLFWNAAFDCNYFIERIKTLGYDPREIICDQTYEEQVCYYWTDERNYSEFAERGDYAKISWNTVVLCQMINFASRRKGRSAIAEYKLDTIGEMIAKVRKLDYSHITNIIQELPYKDYETFVLYNIIDVVVQKCIDVKTADIDFIFNKCLINNTRYEKGYRQTIYLINRFTKEFDKRGYVIGNNINKTNKKEKKFPGALVGDPRHTNDYSKLKINGKPILVADNLMDEDYKSLYPSVDLENNIAPNTLIGIIECDHKVWKNENMFYENVEESGWSRAGEMMDLFITGDANFSEFCHRYLHLANFKELLGDIDEYMKLMCGIATVNIMNNDMSLNPYYYQKIEKINPFYEVPIYNQINPFVFMDKVPDEMYNQVNKHLRGQKLWMVD